MPPSYAMKRFNQLKAREAQVKAKYNAPKKKTTKKSGKSKTSKSYVPRDFFGRSSFVAMNYDADFQLTTSATPNTFGTAVQYRLNSICNPLVGQQTGSALPQGLKQALDVFKSYKVYGCKVSLRVYDPNDDGITVATLITQPSDTGTVLAGVKIDKVAKAYGYRSKIVNNTGRQTEYINRHCNIASLCGISKQQFTNDLSYFTGAVTITAGSGNPTSVPLLHIAAMNTTGVAKTVRVQVKLIYYTKLYNREVLEYGESL